MWASGVFGYLFDYLLCWALFLSLVAHTWCFFRFFPRSRYPKRSLLFGNLLVFLCILGTVALTSESYLRFFSIRTDSFGVSLPARRWFVMYTTLNPLGFRDMEWAKEDRPGVRRIAFLGDSFTYGWGIENPGDRFSDRIQQRFNERQPGSVEVMNVAKPGWGTPEELDALPGLIEAYGIDEVVLGYGANDLESLIPKEPGFDPTRPPEPVWFNPDSSCLLDYLYRRIYLPRRPSVRGYFDWLANGYSDAETWQKQSRKLSALHSICRDKNVELRVVVLPYLMTRGEAYHHDRVYAQLKGLFDAAGVEVLDLAPAIAGSLPGELVVNALDPHPNVRAHALFAKRIWDAFYARP